MLHALAQKLLADAKQADYGNLPIGSLTFSTQYPQLRYGDVDGIGTVTIDQTGNMVGFSPVERCSAHGETAWIPLERVKNIRLEPVAFVPARGKFRETPRRNGGEKK